MKFWGGTLIIAGVAIAGAAAWLLPSRIGKKSAPAPAPEPEKLGPRRLPNPEAQTRKIEHDLAASLA